MSVFFRSMMRAGLVIGAVWGAVGCATAPAYDGPGASQPGAQMRFSKGYQGLGQGITATQEYALAHDDTCAAVRSAAMLSQVTGRHKSVRVAADAPTYVWAETDYALVRELSPSGAPVMTVTNSACRRVVRFTPLRHHEYDVVQLTTYGAHECPIQVNDLTTGAPTPGVEVVDLTACRPPEA